MKAPTTFLVDRAMAKQAPSTDGLKIWRDAAQEQMTETIVDACLFSRPSSYSAGVAARGFGGLLGRSALRQGQKMQAGGLPQHFILAVTAEDVVALERKITSTGDKSGKAGEEVARWKRSTLQVSWKPGGYLYNATLTPPDSQSEVKCCVGLSPLSESFLDLLADPARMTPAV